MTITDNTTRSDADFDARIRHIDGQPDAPESWAATVERMAQAIWEMHPGAMVWPKLSERTRGDYRAFAEAAYRAEHDAALRVVTEPADGGVL